MHDCSFPNTEHCNRRSICILSFPQNSGRPLLTPVNSLRAPSKHGLMETFNKDVDVTRWQASDPRAQSLAQSKQSVKVCGMKEGEALWSCSGVISFLFAIPGSALDTLFPSTLLFPCLSHHTPSPLLSEQSKAETPPFPLISTLTHLHQLHCPTFTMWHMTTAWTILSVCLALFLSRHPRFPTGLFFFQNYKWEDVTIVKIPVEENESCD